MLSRISIALAGAALLLVAFAATASAATINVSTTTDEFNGGGSCSLREAISSANNNAGGNGCTAGDPTGDTISVPDGTYGLTRGNAVDDNNDVFGDLDVIASGTDPLTLTHTGGQATIDASGLAPNPERVLNVVSGTVTIDGFNIQGGNSTDVGNGGGGVMNGGSLTLRNVTIANNQATTGGEGGGLANFSSANLINVTVTGNQANIDGGGVYSAGLATFLNNSTVTGNTADNDNDTNGSGGGISTNGGSEITLQNSIVAGNTDKSAAPSNGPDCNVNTGDIVRAGYDLIQTLTPACVFGPGDTTTGFITGQDPMLGVLNDNGGPVQTRALLEGSPAIDAGSPGGGNACATSDARGISRPQGTRCDLGAFELQGGGGGGGGTAGKCRGKTATITGTDGADKITGTKKADVIDAKGGNDVVNGAKGNDIICGGAGKDKLKGGPGNDKLFGDAGKDKLSGGSGKDKLVGGAGKDSCNGGAKRDTASSCEKKAGFP
jgi:CSLREA domain-containing protein